MQTDSFSGMADHAVVSSRGARRWAEGHPWIFRSDVAERPDRDAGVVMVRTARGQPLGWALWSPPSEISLRLLDRDPDAVIDAEWWHAKLAHALRRREPLEKVATAYRLVHAEADGCPSLICDRYGDVIVVQLLSAGLDHVGGEIVDALRELAKPSGILARHDAAVRQREGLPRETALLHGDVPREIEVHEHGVTYLAAPWDGQKTGAFLDQRENRALVGSLARGRALDCFSYHGSFALHLAVRAHQVTAVDSSAPALARAASNAERNGRTNIRFVEADVFAFLRAEEEQGARYDSIVLDPPAFAKNKGVISAALRGYKEINLRAMRLLAPGGLLFTASCSYHVGKALFLEMLEVAAADTGRRIAIRELRGQPLDHPEVLTIPESGYMKGAVLEAMD
jgi:23S rRNA (cytosine1962-C5)-methyltransferase